MLAYNGCQMTAFRDGAGNDLEPGPAGGEDRTVRQFSVVIASFTRGYKVEDPIEFPARLGPPADGEASGCPVSHVASLNL